MPPGGMAISVLISMLYTTSWIQPHAYLRKRKLWNSIVSLTTHDLARRDSPADYGKFICYIKDCVSQFHIRCMPHKRTGRIFFSGSIDGQRSVRNRSLRALLWHWLTLTM